MKDTESNLSSASDHDHMPADVALEHLTNPLARHTSAFKRACREARETHYGYVSQRKPLEQKLAKRFSRWPIDRLQRQLHRIRIRASIVARSLDKTKTVEIREDIIQRILVPMIFIGTAVKNEIKRRQDQVSKIQSEKRARKL